MQNVMLWRSVPFFCVSSFILTFFLNWESIELLLY